MSAADPLSPGNTLGPFRLSERIGNTVWRGEDSRHKRDVAVKVLTRQLPRDQARRDALVREVRQNATIFHPFVVPMQEIVVAGDFLLMVMELVGGQPVVKKAAGRPLERAEFFRLAYQLAEALRFVHSRNLVHGNVNGDSVMLTAGGRIRLAGFNSSNILPRREGQPAGYAQKGSDRDSVAYMAPEQIMSNTVDIRSDVFSAGSLLYELATGRRPYDAPAAAEIARRIVEEQPPSPKTLHPAVDDKVLAVLGGCLFKDPFRRYKDARGITDQISRYDADAPRIASELATQSVETLSHKRPAETRQSILLLAEVANYAELAMLDANAAAKIAARMQQLLGEAVYLFDGKVLDPFGPRMIAELPTSEAALEAGRKGEFDFSNEREGTNPIDVRLLLHSGALTLSGGLVSGPAIDSGMAALQQLPHRKLFLSEDFARAIRASVRVRDEGARGGLKLFSIVPPEASVIEVTTAELDAIAAEEQADADLRAVTLARESKRRRTRWAIGGAVIASAAAVAAIVATRGGNSGAATAPVPLRAPVTVPPASAAHPRPIVIAPFTVEGTDPLLQQRAAGTRAAVIAILATMPELRIVEGSAGAAFSAQLRSGAAGAEIAPSGGATVAASAAPDAASAIQAFTSYVASQLHVTAPVFQSPAALNFLAESLSASDPSKSETALRAALKADPRLLAAQLTAMSLFAARGKDADALAAASQVLSLDRTNIDAARFVGRRTLQTGDVKTAFGAWSLVLQAKPGDLEALNIVARYAAGVGDAARFTAALAKLQKAPPATVAAHSPDMLLSAGRLEAAIDQYYDIEVKEPANPFLSLAIGRISVLRRATSVAELELKKLETSDPRYGYPLLSAYIAASKGDAAAAEHGLETAHARSVPGDDYNGCAAEVYALLADPKRVVAALGAAADRREPMISYLLMNHLFDYVQSDPSFQKVRARLAAGQEEIRSALTQVNF